MAGENTLGELLVDIKVKQDELEARLKSAEDTIKKSSKKHKEEGDKISKSWLDTASRIYTAFATVKKALDISKESAEYNQSLNALNRATGGHAQEMVDHLKRISDGTISNKDIVLTANRAMALGVADDMDTIGKFLDIARLKGEKLGLSTTQAFDNIVTGLGRGSPLILDNLGIVTKGWEEEAKAAGVAYDKQFIMNKVLQEGSKELEAMGPRVLSAKDKFEQMGASADNLKLIIGERLQPLFTKFGGVIVTLVDAFSKLPPGAQEVAVALLAIGTAATTMIKVIGLSASTAGVLSAALLTLYATVKAVEYGMDAGKKATLGWTAVLNQGDFKKANNDLKDYDKSFNDFQKSINAVGKTWEEYKKTQIEIFKGNYGTILFEKGKEAADKYWTAQINGLNKVREEWSQYKTKIDNTTAAIEKYNQITLLQGEGSTAIVDIENKTKAELKKINDDYFTYIGDLQNQRAADENASYEAALESLQLLLENKRISQDEFNEQALEIETLHKENLAKIEEENTNFRLQLQLNAMQNYRKNYEQLTIAQKTEILKMTQDQIKFWDDIKNEAQKGTKAVVDNYAGGITEMIWSGEKWRKNFVDFIEDMIVSVGKLITKMIIYKGIVAGLNLLTGGLFSFLSTGGVNRKGQLVYAQTGFRPRGDDTIPVMMSPNERIMSERQNLAFENLLRTFSSQSLADIGVSSPAGDNISNSYDNSNEYNSRVINNYITLYDPSVDIINQLMKVSTNTNSKVFRR